MAEEFANIPAPIRPDIVSLNSKINTVQTELTFETNSYYHVNEGLKAYKNVTGNVVTISTVITCDSSYSTSPGYAVMNVPKPKNELYITVPPLTAGQANIRIHIDTNGNLYIRFGTASQVYDICITYVCA